jgi:hypothetical protein
MQNSMTANEPSGSLHHSGVITPRYPEQAVESDDPLGVERARLPAWGPVDVWRLEREQTRQRLCNVIIAIYWLLILEGALRKWIAPSYQKELFFIRDPLVLYVYVIAITKGFWPRRSVLFWSGLFLALLGFSLIVFHLGDRSLMIMAYGWRNYFAYLPLAFIIGEQFRYDDWLRLVRFTVVVALPIAVLCVFQSVAPVTAPINAGFGGSSDELFYVANVTGRITRACGTFTSGTGQVQLIGSLTAMLLWLWSNRRARSTFGKWILPAAAAGTITMLIVGGHRAAFVSALLVASAGAAMTGVIYYSVRTSTKVFVGAGLLVILVLLSGKYLFPEQGAAILTRTRGVAERDSAYSVSEGLVNRVLWDFVHFVGYIPETNILGRGLGFSGNASEVLGLSSGFEEGAEDDWSRNILDLGPIIGILFILYRIAFVVALVIGAGIASRRYRDALPGLLVGFVGITLLYGQISGQGSVNGYGWIFAGMCMAANAGHLTISDA